MSDDPNKRINFRENKDAKADRVQFRKENELGDGKGNCQNITDKDNTSFRFDPPNKTQNPAPNLAPGGQMGNRPLTTPPPSGQEKIIIEFTPDEQPDIDLSNDGSLTAGEFPDGSEFLVKSDFDPDINDGEGHISRLTIVEDGKPTVHFDGSWELKPFTEDQEQRVADLEQQFGAVHSNEFKSFDDLNPEQDNDIDI